MEIDNTDETTKEMRSIYDMKLHEVRTLSDHNTEIMRVHKGWIYIIYSQVSHKWDGYNVTSTFVPDES